MPLKKRKRVVIAMSGGVDSSTAAYLLKEEGYEVVGMTMQIWDYSMECDKFGSCCSPDDLYDARRVAEQLSIPFYTVNLEKEFKRDVVDYFIDEYLHARTPNPCILCNEKIKFYYLLKKAEEIEADYIATGHYARILKDKEGYHLLKGVDENKDQSYFLFSLNQVQLSKILFPIGDLRKAEVRKIAKKAKLKTAQKSESQEICFVPDRNYSKFLEENAPKGLPKSGNFVDLERKVLGKHKGIHSYTVGQRRGLNISHGKRLYVLKIDTEKNEVILGSNDDLLGKEFTVNGVSWISGNSAVGKKGIKTKIRYNKEREASSKLEEIENGRLKVTFDKPQRAITPGQAAVFYRGDEVLGGGWILG